MTHKDIFKEAFPQNRQIGGSHLQKMKMQHVNLYQKMIYRFQGNVVIRMQVQVEKWCTRPRKDYTLLRVGNKKIKRY